MKFKVSLHGAIAYMSKQTHHFWRSGVLKLKYAPVLRMISTLEGKRVCAHMHPAQWVTLYSIYRPFFSLRDVVH